MDNRDGIRDFLASRRAKITPEHAGLPVYGFDGSLSSTGTSIAVASMLPSTLSAPDCVAMPWWTDRHDRQS
jgi:hypothetical protein